MSDFVWVPQREWIENANVSRLMAKLGYAVDPHSAPRTEEAARAFIKRSQQDPEWFWAAALDDMGFVWETPYERLLDTSRGNAWADWFVGGRTNIVLNCVDRHANGPNPTKIALIAETEDEATRCVSYAALAAHVAKVANALVALGVGPGDRVACYMPMLAEVVFAMLATHKVGAVFVPIFSGYAPPAVRERLEDADVKLVFTADGSLRRGRTLPLKAELDQAIADLPELRHTIVLRRAGTSVGCPMTAGRDHYWHELVEGQSSRAGTVAAKAMDTALILYTSGTTGKPKGTVHTHAGCLAQTGKELRYNFDLRPDDVFWWFTDIGWMMGPWEIIGCFMHGATLVVFEGAPDYPAPDRIWRSVEQHRVTTLGISPTAVRLLMRGGDGWVDPYGMPTLRLLGSTGEPWDAESYTWYFEHVGRGRCPVINISGGTDIVGCFLAPLPIMPLKSTTLQSPGLGMAVDVFDEGGQSVTDEVGYLVCTKPAPSMTRGLWKQPDAYLDAYWSKFPEVWNHGDWAKVDRQGYWFLFGRADDTMNVAGRRVGPGEIEATLIGHDAVSEAAAVGVPDRLKGTEIVCFVVLPPAHEPSEQLRSELGQAVVAALGKVDRPKAVLFVDDLPKTRSAKILRRLIRRRYLGDQDLGDLSSVANPEAIEAIARAR